jgi:hypothetical protein
VKRIKPAYIRSRSGAISTENELREALNEPKTQEKTNSVSFVGSLISRLPSWFNSQDESTDDMPVEGEPLRLSKSRYRGEELELLFVAENSVWSDWFKLSECPELSGTLRESDLLRTQGSRNKFLNYIAEWSY